MYYIFESPDGAFTHSRTKNQIILDRNYDPMPVVAEVEDHLIESFMKEKVDQSRRLSDAVMQNYMDSLRSDSDREAMRIQAEEKSRRTSERDVKQLEYDISRGFGGRK